MYSKYFAQFGKHGYLDFSRIFLAYNRLRKPFICSYGIFKEIQISNYMVNNVNFQIDVNTEVGVVRDIRLKELRLYTDYGRCSRPLFIVESQRLLIKKKHIRALQQRV
jgi:DNA-directed RNA polymerase II subunit RPB2